jgi:hypothetical protein
MSSLGHKRSLVGQADRNTLFFKVTIMDPRRAMIGAPLEPYDLPIAIAKGRDDIHVRGQMTEFWRAIAAEQISDKAQPSP